MTHFIVKALTKQQLRINSMIPRLSTRPDLQQVWKGTLWGKPVAVKLLPLLDVDERQLECLRREVAVLLHTTGECKQVSVVQAATHDRVLKLLMLPG